jgi:arabinofuranosyltransferase
LADPKVKVTEILGKDQSVGNSKPVWAPLDSILLVALTLFATLLAVRSFDWHSLPVEDSLMLLRYATHFAAGKGITWNVGAAPVEGATDFLYMVLVGLCIKLTGLGAIAACRVLLLPAHVATVAIVYYGARKLFDSSRLLAAVLAIYVAAGPGVVYIMDGVSVPLYGLIVLLAWYFVCLNIVRGPSLCYGAWFGIFALLTGLVRPDGVFLSIFMGAALMYALRRQAIRPLTIAACIFLVGGTIYFLWRWHYFGYLFPNPFYRKGGGHLYLSGLTNSIGNSTKLVFPMLPVLTVALFGRAKRRVLTVLIPLVGFACIWVLLSNENNAHMRFQYVTLPLVAMSLPWIVGGLRPELGPQTAQTGPQFSLSAQLVCGFVLLGMSMMYWKNLLYPILPPGSGAYNIALGLSRWKDKGYTIAVTEAGVIPYFSQWNAIDAYGLNDLEIVHNPKGVTEAYLDQVHPEIIMEHFSDFANGYEDFYNAWTGTLPPKQDLKHLMPVLSHYARTHNYEVAAMWGDAACNIHAWYVRRDIPEATEIVQLIRTEPHFFLDSRVLSVDYRDQPVPKVCQDPGIRLPLKGWPAQP